MEGEYKLKTYSIRAYNKKELLDGDNKFTKGFTGKQVIHNNHYLHKETGLILQANDDNRYVDCHAEGFIRKPLTPIGIDGIEKIILNADKEGHRAKLILDDYDKEEIDYFEHGLRLVVKPNNETINSYIKRFRENKGDIEGLLRGVTVKDKNLTYVIDCYKSGSFYIQSYKGSYDLTGEDFLIKALNMLGIVSSKEELEYIPMYEMEIEEHPYSKLHLLLSYLDGNIDGLSEEVQDAYYLSREELKTLADKHKEGKVYKRN